MTNKLIGVFGASGFGREVIPVVRQMFQEPEADLVFIDDNPVADELNGYRVLSFETFCSLRYGKKLITISIADSKIREKLNARCADANIEVLQVVSPNSVIFDEVELGIGAIICPFVTLTSNITIGKSFHANIYSYIAHDCVIGDFVTFAPNVKCNGNVVIEDHAYIGTGAILRQGTPEQPLRIGKGAVIGMGAVVTKDVPAGVTVVGNPARILKY